MKWKPIIAIVVAVLTVILLLANCYRVWLQQCWTSRTDFTVRSLAMAVEMYREQIGHYPREFSDLLTDMGNDERSRKSIGELVAFTKSNAWNDTFEYRILTNGFAVIVVGPDVTPLAWFGRQRRMERQFRTGEILSNSGGRDGQ